MRPIAVAPAGEARDRISGRLPSVDFRAGNIGGARR